MLRVEGLEVSYGDVRALRGISFTVKQGDLMTLLGSNGAGKTTTLQAISGMVKPSGGQIFFEGQSLANKKPHEIAQLGIAHVPEGRRVFTALTVMENLLVGSHIPAAKAQRERGLEFVFTLFPRLAERKTQVAGTMSGGEQQMLSIGRALMMQPKLLMLDEPSGGLAPVVVDLVFERIAEIHRNGLTVLVVEQNAAVSLETAEHGVVLENGQIALRGHRDELLSSDYVQTAYLGL